MARLCFALDLVDDDQAIADYERQHKPGAVWAEIIDDIRAEGYLSMEIWRAADRLFMVAETTEDFPRGQRSSEMSIICDRWQLAMDRYQRRLPQAQADVKWMPMNLVFDLEAHSGSTDDNSLAIRADSVQLGS